ncbi:MAG TPA: EAL domain-containing protein [Chakrabartia sp.]|nr:EAL domain-containing protein [Chakrabartia sp.]
MRILVIDDEPAMHEAYRRTFDQGGRELDGAALQMLARELFAETSATPELSGSDVAPTRFNVDHAEQGLDGLKLVAEALEAGQPYQIAFIDIRMPPGIDGKETAKRIREIDPDINLVIVTGYSDHSAIEIARVAGPVDKLFYVSKPFDADEVLQLARALCQRWINDKELAQVRSELADRVAQLERQGIELAANEARAQYLATHDSLTGAPNRLAFLHELSRRLHTGERVSIAIIDLDRFKNINDSLGHVAGDELIRQVYLKMAAVAGDSGLVARLGGDEFAVAVFDSDIKAAHALCEAMIRACSEQFSIFGHQVQSGASAGVAVSSGDPSEEPIDLLRLADLALYDAKRKGGEQARIFSQAMDESIRFRNAIEDGLRTAIANEEFVLRYQPIVGRNGSPVAGFEALLRWSSPEHGPVSPAVFIPIAEESQLIHEIGHWVTDHALDAVQDWPGQYVSINFSPRQFRMDGFAQMLMDRVRAKGVAPERVQIEVTETAIFDDHERAARTLRHLHDAGFRVALDDFGTGYSSLFNIRNFPLDCLKIDRSFVENMGREPQSAAIIHSVTHLARSLGLEVVAEGVETEIQMQALRLAGCGFLQGYFLGAPMTRAEAGTLLSKPQALPGTAQL